MDRNPKFWFESVQGAKRTGTFRYGTGGWYTIGFDEQGHWKMGWMNNNPGGLIKGSIKFVT